MRARVMVAAMAAVVLAGLLAPAIAGARSRTFTMTAGPFALEGFEVRWVRLNVPPPPVAGKLTYMYARLVDARGERIPVRRVMLHHVLFQNYGRPGHRVRTSCPQSGTHPVYGTGEEHQALRLPEGYGYPVHPRDGWYMRAMLMSHRLEDEKVYVQYRVAVDDDPGLEPVVPFWIRSTGCRGPSFEVYGAGGPGSVQEDSFDWKAPVTGRIVAAGGHLHGGARELDLTEPGCENRRLLGTDPWFGLDSHPVYNVRPLLHEPGPISTEAFLSETGVPVRRGQRIRINATYDNEQPHPQAMAVMHVYIAPGGVRPPPCAPLPADAREQHLRADTAGEQPLGVPGRPRSPKLRVQLYALNRAGRPAPLARPSGPVTALQSGAVSRIRFGDFEHPNLSLPVGGKLTWKFNDDVFHNVVLANGPWSAGAPRIRYRAPEQFTTTFPLPGTYQLFCQLHPLTMHQQVEVR